MLVDKRTSELKEANSRLQSEIAERKRTGAGLTQARERLRTVIDSAPIILFALGREGVFTLSEGKGLEALGRNPNQVVGQSIFEVYRDRPEILAEIRGALAGEARTLVADISGVTTDARYEPVRDWSGQITGVVGVVHDITALKRAEESVKRANLNLEEANKTLEERVGQRTGELQDGNRQLLEAQDQLVRTERLAAIGQLAGSVAHDLRNPLGAINNAVYYLKDKLGSSELGQSDPRIPQFLDILAEEVQHSNKIISDLLTFSRAGPLSLAPTDLGAIIGSSLSRIEARDNVRVVTRLDEDLPEVSADGEQLHQVFMNLVGNAQDAMSAGGELTIAARRVDGYVETTFSDTGSGISDDDMMKVSDPLFTTKTRGTGLDLATCQRIVSEHGGSIDATSSQGEGSTFTVRLPLTGDRSKEALRWDPINVTT